MSDMDEVIKLEISQDEFVRNVTAKVLASDLCEESFKAIPTLMLFAIMYSREVWDKLVEYSRMKTVSNAINSMLNEEEK